MSDGNPLRAARAPVLGLAVAAVSAANAAAARLAGRPASDVDPDRVAVAYSSERWFRLDARQPRAFAPESAFFPTRDGWVRTHATYPHHARALLAALRLPSSSTATEVASALAAGTTQTAVASVAASGGLCVAVLPVSETEDARLRKEPLVHLDRIGRSPRRAALVGDASAPLRGIRVLDLTRVLAGPVATRTLALLGADVLRIDSPRLPEIAWQHLDTGHGKRSTLLDLATAPDRSVFDSLLETADVIVLGYRPGTLERFGLSPSALAERRPGIVIARVSAWGETGGRGFDSLVQAASGIALHESANGHTPTALPAQALDHSAGYHLAAAILTAIDRQTEEGGSWLATTSLRRMAAQLLDGHRGERGGEHRGEHRDEPDLPVAEHRPFDAASHLQHFTVGEHALTTTAPAISYLDGPAAFAPPRPWADDSPAWKDTRDAP
ncbi:MAG: CoA transferase [Candidatus Microbacterium phytovorans]|uniref:CoA transferase n=1 Tax=Candidatus Microbacterium phytovorans TaxID=3121374 RepID=A0AAJ5W314_9MICO|nr:CoA transferase [Microbacterium sp.]WEK14069.1 MAG: CoA transferase [Microbacterium sp.]